MFMNHDKVFLKPFLLISVVASFAGLISCNPGKVSSAATAQSNVLNAQRTLKPPVSHSTPASVGYVYDQEGLFTEVQRHKLDSLMRLFESTNLIPIKLVTLGANNVPASNFDSNNLALLKQWDALHNNSQKCMTISMSKEFNRVKIDFGSFVNKLLSPAEATHVVETTFQPAISKGTYYEGSFAGLQELMSTVRKNIVFDPKPIKKPVAN
jgi:uncharacterized membrane protein YgcG